MISAPDGQPLRVVQVVRSAVYGGVENHVYELCRHFKASGIDITLVSLVDCDVNEAFSRLGINVVRLHDSMGWSKRIVGAMFELRHVLSLLRPDVVHLHGIRPTFVGSLATVFGKFGTRPAVISTLHGSYSLMAVGDDGEARRLLLLLAKLFHWVGFALSDRVVVDCKTLIEEVRKVYRGMALRIDSVIERKVRVVYNGVDLRPFEGVKGQRDIRSVLGVPESAVVVGSISRLDEPKKGVGVLLRAARIVLSRCPDVHFVICGEGYSRVPLNSLANELGIGDRVHFLGYWDDALEVYRSLDIFVLPSLSEGFPTVNLEAMASGLPVITTNVGGAAEAVTDGVCGFVVPPRNEAALAGAIVRLCKDASLRVTMGTRGKKAVNEMFSSDTTARGVLGVYREMIGRQE